MKFLFLQNHILTSHTPKCSSLSSLETTTVTIFWCWDCSHVLPLFIHLVPGVEPRALCRPGKHCANWGIAPAQYQNFLLFLHVFKLGCHSWRPEPLIWTMMDLAAEWKIESGLHRRQLLFLPSFWVKCTHSSLSASSGRWLLHSKGVAESPAWTPESPSHLAGRLWGIRAVWKPQWGCWLVTLIPEISWVHSSKELWV